MDDSANNDVLSPHAPARAVDRAGSSHARVRLLAAVLLFELTLLVVAVTRDPFLLYRIASPFHPEAAPASPLDPARFRNDPRLGTALPTNAIGASIRAKARPSSVGYLLVPIGDCAGCIKADLVGWRRQCAARGVSMVILTSAPEHAAHDFFSRLRCDAPYVCDPLETVERHLNVLWSGRPYLYSPGWRLRWVPRSDPLDSLESDPRFLAALKGDPR